MGCAGSSKARLPHSHEREDESAFVSEVDRRAGGEEETEVDAGGLLLKPAPLVHALWNPTDEPAVVDGLVAQQALNTSSRRWALSPMRSRRPLLAIAERYGQRPPAGTNASMDCRSVTTSTCSGHQYLQRVSTSPWP